MEKDKITRRKFLAKSLKVGTGLALTPLLFPSGGPFSSTARARLYR